MTAAAARRVDPLSLAEIQELLQSAILSGDETILALIEDNSRTSRETLFGVYRHAYVGRLIDILRNEYPLLAHYVGDERFAAIARSYIAAHPSRSQNARWFGCRLPQFLEARATEEIAEHIAGLCQIEKAVSDAFDAPDAAALGVADLARLPPDSWGRLIFTPHPSVSRLELDGNAFGIWRALKNEEPPPAFKPSDAKSNVLVWRQDLAPMARELGYEESMIWTEACAGSRFDALCEMLATYDDPGTAAIRAAGYLQGWLTTEMLTSVRLAEAGD